MNENSSYKEIVSKEIDGRKKIVYDYIFSRNDVEKFKPKDIYDGVVLYPNSQGKSLRPSILLLSCGAVGGKETTALPAAAAVEIFHTWTLVHDDWIDRDSLRRGTPTVHAYMAKRGKKNLNLNSEEATHYGNIISLLSGDVLQGWSIGGLLTNLSLENSVDPLITLNLIKKLSFIINASLVEGETLDVIYSMKPLNNLSENDIIRMLYLKTGVLYQFCGEAGAIIGLGNYEPEHKYVRALSEFTKNCGIAFQIQDDIIGVIGKENVIGKPRWSDIKEGKKTIILWKSYQEGSDEDIKFIDYVIKNPNVTDEELQSVENLFFNLGAIDYTKEMAKAYIVGDAERGIDGALKYLEMLPNNSYKKILEAWAYFMIEREF